MAATAELGFRIPYHRDGTTVRRYATRVSGLTDDNPSVWAQTYNPLVTVGADAVKAMNGLERAYSSAHASAANGLSTDSAVGFVFPRPMDLTHIAVIANPFPFYTEIDWIVVEYSTDTTDGWDGTWAVASGFAYSDNANPGGTGYLSEYLSDPASFQLECALSDVVGLRVIAGPGVWANIHLYGEPSTYGDELVIWDPVADQRLDFNDLFFSVVQGGNDTLSFRVKNVSATKDATDGVVTLTNNAGGYWMGTTVAQVATDHGELDNGVDTPADSCDILIGGVNDPLGPGDISDVIDFNFDIGATWVPGAFEAELVATATFV